MLFSLIFHMTMFVAPKTTLSVDDNCFRCLCAASSDCTPNVRCSIYEPEIRLCGPFQISENLWRLANPEHADVFFEPFKYELCANSISCSMKVLKDFQQMLQNECQLKSLSCGQFSSIHLRTMLLETYYDSEDEPTRKYNKRSVSANQDDFSMVEKTADRLFERYKSVEPAGKQAFRNTHYDDDYDEDRDEFVKWKAAVLDCYRFNQTSPASFKSPSHGFQSSSAKVTSERFTDIKIDYWRRFRQCTSMFWPSTRS